MFGFLVVAASLIYLIHICFRLLILSDETSTKAWEMEMNPTAKAPVEAATRPVDSCPVRDFGVDTSRLVTAPRRAPHPNVPANGAMTSANPTPIRSVRTSTSQSIVAPRSTPLNTFAPTFPAATVTTATALEVLIPTSFVPMPPVQPSYGRYPTIRVLVTGEPNNSHCCYNRNRESQACAAGS